MKKTAPFHCLLALMFLLVDSGCATLPDNVDREMSTVILDTHDTYIGKQVQAEAQAHLGESGYLLLPNGLDAFVARVLLAQRAERSIDNQYYMIHNDVVGSLFIYQLYEAAERGVRVRLLVDDIDQEGRDLGTEILNSHPNIQVRIFNPFARNTGRTLQYIVPPQVRFLVSEVITKDISVTDNFSKTGTKDYITGKGRQKNRVRARDVVCYWAVIELGEPMIDVARRFDITPSAIGYAVQRGEKK